MSQARIRRLQSSIPTSYTVYLDPDGVTYRAESCLSGAFDYSGTVATTVINAAINALTAGRTWKEAVALKGGITLTDPIVVPSYTVLDLTRCRLTLSSGALDYMVKIDGAGLTEIEIWGGTLNGNSAGNVSASGYTAIYIYGTTGNHASKIRVIGTRILSPIWCGIVMAYVDNFEFEDIYTEYSGKVYTGADVPHGIYISDCNHGSVVNHHSYQDYGSGIKLTSVVDVSVSKGRYIEPLILLGNKYGIFINGTVTALTSDVSILDNYIKFDVAANTRGIYVDTAFNSYLTIKGNKINTCDNGILLNSTTYSVVTGNEVRNSDYAAIRVLSASDYNVIANNNIADSGKIGGGAMKIIDVGVNDSFDIEARSSVLDLSGGASDVVVFQAPSNCQLAGMYVFYTELSSADAGVNIRVGRYQNGVALDADYYNSYTSEISKNLGYSKAYVSTDLLKSDIVVGDSVTVGTAGGKTGTGEIAFVLKIAKNC